jgi:simple sugar transport system ATP-binding protein
MEFVLEMIDICKTFYGDGLELRANDHINFTLRKGEIHALLGENGAGKSTLVNALFRKPDSGTILLRGEKVNLSNPVTALKYGLAIARQDLSKSLIERHTVAENILSISEGFFLSLATVERKVLEALQKFELGDLDPNTKVWKLSGGEKQRIEILKALITDPDILILDEPTSMLTPIEIDNLFKLLNNLKAQGKSIIIITHHLEEAIDHSDRVTVLRHGQVVETLDTAKERKKWPTHEEAIRHLAKLMVGKEVLYELKRKKLEPGKITAEFIDLHANNDMGDRVVHGISLTLKENQILGIAGISGNGQREFVEAILNWRKAESGQVLIHSFDSQNKPTVNDVTQSSIKSIRDSGIAYIPEDRRKALIPDLSIRENLMLNSYRDSNGLFIEEKAIIERTEKLMDVFKIKAPNALATIQSLSGGNKQKVVVAREMTLVPPSGQNLIVIAENPTFGLDVGTTQFVREELLRLREESGAIMLISSDLTEILSLCDIIAVIYKGKIIGTLQAHEATRENIGLMMGGTTVEEVKK